MSFALLSVTDNGGIYAPVPELAPRLPLVNALFRCGVLFSPSASALIGVSLAARKKRAPPA
jgi:hypothetical protein